MAKSSFVERNKAVRKAWIREQELVQDGQGTREWTPEQQKDILEKGRAYDENGKAFEGQHMKSAEQYPEYQGKPGNIQFLTRAEHLEAHDGNWQNPTNWYFNPVTKEKVDFGEESFIPCKIIFLPEPVVKLSVEVENNKKSDIETVKNKNSKVAQSAPTKMESPRIDLEPKPKVGIKNAFRTGIKTIVEFSVKHPMATKVLKKLVIAAVATITVEALSESSKSNSTSSESRNRANDSNNEYDNSEEIDTFEDDDITNDEAAKSSDKPYTPNDVSAHEQTYHTKDGTVKRKKEPYHREGKNKA